MTLGSAWKRDGRWEPSDVSGISQTTTVRQFDDVTSVLGNHQPGLSVQQYRSAPPERFGASVV